MRSQVPQLGVGRVSLKRTLSGGANGELVFAARSCEAGEGPVMAVLVQSRRKGQ